MSEAEGWIAMWLQAALLVFAFWGIVFAVICFIVYHYTGPWGCCLKLFGHGGCI